MNSVCPEHPPTADKVMDVLKHTKPRDKGREYLFNIVSTAASFLLLANLNYNRLSCLLIIGVPWKENDSVAIFNSFL